MTPSPPTARRLGRRPAFVLVGALVLTLLAASAAPSPLYPLWAQRWGASPGALTAVFAVYALALLVALAVAGRTSDAAGRRPVLLLAVVLELAALALFLAAGGVGLLLLARAVQGVATGLAIGAAGAALLDLEPAERPGLGALVNSVAPTAGLAVGAVGSGAVVQALPAPAPVVFGALAAAFALLLAALAALPETVRPPGGADRAARRRAVLASLRPRLAVPGAARRPFAAAVPVFVATWAMGALHLSLGPAIAAGVLRTTHPLTGALLVASFSAGGAVASVAASRAPATALVRGGAGALAAGTALGLAGLQAVSLPLYAVGTAVAGAGFGAAFLGALRGVVAAAPAEGRAGVLTAVYVVSYLSFSAPAVAAGALVPSVGLRAVATGYGAAVVVLALAALVASAAGGAPARRRRAGAVATGAAPGGGGRTP